MRVSVIIPTMATPQRSVSLKRSIDSVRKSSRLPVCIIVVVNGDKYDRQLCDWLRLQSDIVLEMLPCPSLTGALLRGRELVDTEFFSTLDDDDEYLNGAIDKRIDFLDLNKCFDVVISNGYRNVAGSDSLWHPSLQSVQVDLIGSLMEANWLTSCNALYRSCAVDIDLFRDAHPYAEWTWMGYRLALAGVRIGADDVPTFRINDTPGSLSKSPEYYVAYLSLFKRMLEISPTPKVAKMISKKLGAALHHASDVALKSGDYSGALRLHLKSVFECGGWKYVMYTRYFLK